jgi:hypothetical protein
MHAKAHQSKSQKASTFHRDMCSIIRIPFHHQIQHYWAQASAHPIDLVFLISHSVIIWVFSPCSIPISYMHKYPFEELFSQLALLYIHYNRKDLRQHAFNNSYILNPLLKWLSDNIIIWRISLITIYNKKYY